METSLGEWRKVARWLRWEVFAAAQPSRLLLGITFFGAVFRLYLLGSESLWLDEAFGVALSQHSLGDLLQLIVRTDTHPPLYYVLLHFWLNLGSSEGVVRLLSVLFSIAAIPLMYLVASSLYEDEHAGLLGAVIMALSPFQIWHGQEARMYAMLTFFVLLSAYFFIQALRHGSRKKWAAYALATSAALYTDNGAIWYVLAITAFFLLSWSRFPRQRKEWLISQAAIALLYMPWVPSLLAQTGQVTESFWLSPPSFSTVLGAFLDFNSYNFPWMGLSVLYMTMLFVWTYIVPERGWTRRLPTMWLFIPLAASLLLSLRQPIFLSRNLIAASLGYYLLLVGTIHRFDSAKASAVLLLPLVVMNLVSIGHNAWGQDRAPWRSLTEHVANAARERGEGLILFVPSYAELPFSYYAAHYELPVTTQGYPEDEVLLHSQPQKVEDLAEVLEGQPYVWLVLRDVEAVDPQWEVKGWLDSNGYVRGADFVHEDISALTYIRWDLVADGLRTVPGLQASQERQMYLPLIQNRMPPQPPPVTIHVIGPGDTLWSIARRYGTTVEALMQQNDNVDPNRLRVGQELIIP